MSQLEVTTNACKTINSLELLEQINMFRKIEKESIERDGINIGGRDGRLLNPKKHKDLLTIIRDEFDEEIRGSILTPTSQVVDIPNGGKRTIPMFNLTINQAKQILIRESKYVRKSVIRQLNKMETALKEVNKEHSIVYDIGLSVLDTVKHQKNLHSLGGMITQERRKLKKSKERTFKLIEIVEEDNPLDKILTWK